MKGLSLFSALLPLASEEAAHGRHFALDSSKAPKVTTNSDKLRGASHCTDWVPHLLRKNSR